MAWEVQYTEEFGDWYEDLTESEQDSIDRNVYLLEQFGPALPDRYSKPVIASRFSHMRELRIEYGREPIRLLYAFDPRRVALLLLGGTESEDDLWYENSCREQTRSMSKICENEPTQIGELQFFGTVPMQREIWEINGPPFGRR
jgi:hypothetical protein